LFYCLLTRERAVIQEAQWGFFVILFYQILVRFATMHYNILLLLSTRHYWRNWER